MAHILLAFIDGFVTETCGPIQDRTVVVALNGLKLVSPRVLSNLGGCVERSSVISYWAGAFSFFRCFLIGKKSKEFSHGKGSWTVLRHWKEDQRSS